MLGRGAWLQRFLWGLVMPLQQRWGFLPAAAVFPASQLGSEVLGAPWSLVDASTLAPCRKGAGTAPRPEEGWMC